MLKALKKALGAAEIMFLLGLSAVFAGIWLLFGPAWALVALGAVLLFAAFKNSAEREKGTS